MNTKLPDLICIGGATATGKSMVAVELAKRIEGEIVSVDSMQIYRGMDIGTDKPPLEIRQQIPHYLIDIVDPWEKFDAAKFVELAKNAIDTIRNKGKIPILCGGTGMYFKAFIYGLDPLPSAEINLRRQIMNTPLPELLEELRLADPQMYAQIDRTNPRRVYRAIEILRLTGKPPSSLRTKWKDRLPTPYPFFCLRRTRSDLKRRIELRVKRMFEEGFVEEVKQLIEAGLRPEHTAAQAIGYKQIFEYLAGKRTLEETVKLVIIRTYQFAKRQETWFKHQFEAQWIYVCEDDPPSHTAEKILALLQRH